MKFQKLFVFCFLLMSLVANAQKSSYNPEREKKHDLIHTKLKVDFNFSDKTMNGEAWIKAKPHFYSADKITLDANTMLIHNVSMDNRNLNYNYDEYEIVIDLPKTYKKDDSKTYK